MRLATQIRELVGKVNPKVMIATNEGHAWERLAFYSARQANPAIKCIGYMPAPLFQKQHAIRRSLAKDYNPYKIFTSGHVQKNQLERTESLKNIPIEVLGSRRCFEKKALSDDTSSETRNSGHRHKTCLVIPEGIESEIHLLFEFSLECARQNTDIKFIWRLHPIISFDALVKINNVFKSLPDNIELSSRDLDQDLDWCHWVLYRGSSAVIQAVVAGLRPVYLHVPGQMKIDPLFELDEWKIEIETHHDFVEALNSSTSDVTQYQKARDYCLKTYVPFDYSTIINTLS